MRVQRVFASTQDASSRFWQAMYAAALLALFSVGAWLQSQVHLNHDVGWILRSAGWLLDGRRFGNGVVDPNPPLIWFLSTPAAAVARAGWLSEPVAIRAYIWSLCAFATLLCYIILRPMSLAGRRGESCALVLGIAASCAVLPGVAFAQREFLSFIFAMPYALLVAGRLAYGAQYSIRLSAIAGCLAGIGFGFKPWLLAVPAGIEIFYLIRNRRLRALIRPETLAIGLTIAVYLLAVMLFARDYLLEAIPLIRAVYWAYEKADFGQMVAGADGVASMVLISAGLLLFARRLDVYVGVLAISVAGFAFNYWVQKKGFFYHAYPMIAACFVLLAYSSACALRRLCNEERFRGLVRTALLAVLALILYQPLADRSSSVRRWFDSQQINGGAQGMAKQALINRVDALTASGDYVYAFSTHPYPAFSTLNYVDAEWASALPCQFVIPAHAKRHKIVDQRQRKEVESAVAHLRETVLSEFVRYRPKVVLVNSSFRRLGLGYSKFDDVAFYLEDPRFAEEWRRYVAVEGVSNLPNIKIFVRGDE